MRHDVYHLVTHLTCLPIYLTAYFLQEDVVLMGVNKTKAIVADEKK